MKEIKFVTGGWTDYFPLAGGIILIAGGWTDYLPLAGGMILILSGLFVYYRKKRRKM